MALAAPVVYFSELLTALLELFIPLGANPTQGYHVLFLPTALLLYVAFTRPQVSLLQLLGALPLPTAPPVGVLFFDLYGRHSGCVGGDGDSEEEKSGQENRQLRHC